VFHTAWLLALAGERLRGPGGVSGDRTTRSERAVQYHYSTPTVEFRDTGTESESRFVSGLPASTRGDSKGMHSKLGFHCCLRTSGLTGDQAGDSTTPHHTLASSTSTIIDAAWHGNAQVAFCRTWLEDTGFSHRSLYCMMETLEGPAFLSLSRP
jgi:hypothetical protein